MADSEKPATPVPPTDPGKPAHYATAPEDRVSRPTKILYAMGAGADNAGFNGPKQLANPVYNIALGLNPALISTVIAITRLWDAFTDPFMGKITDNAKGGRFGRRRPFMLLGIVLCAVLFPVIWMAPSGLGQWGMFAFLLVTMLLFYTAFTIYTVPFSAQGFELTPDYHERTRVHAYYAFFGNLSIIAIQWLYRLTQMEIFDNVQEGAVAVSFGFGGLMLVLGLMPVLFVKEKVFRKSKASQTKLSFWKSLKASRDNKPFLYVLVITVTMVFGLNLVNSMGLYINIYHVHGGETKPASTVQGWLGTTYALSTFATIPIISAVATRWGKRLTLGLCLWLMLIGALSSWFLYNPAYPYLMLLTAPIMTAGNSGMWMLTRAMVADICDYDELETDHLREGMLGALYTWVQKFGWSLGFLVSGFLLVATGFDQAFGGEQPEGVVTRMRLLFAGVPGLAVLAALYFLHRYPLTEERVHEIREELEARRGKVE